MAPFSNCETTCCKKLVHVLLYSIEKYYWGSSVNELLMRESGRFGNFQIRWCGSLPLIKGGNFNLGAGWYTVLLLY